MSRGVVYRCYNADDSLLYIGTTYGGSARERIAQHRTAQRHNGASPWIVDVVRVEEDLYPTWQAASAAEVALIAALRPPHNRLHNPDWLAAKRAAREARAS